MNKVQILTGVACVSALLATGAFAEILGVQPGTSDNPKDNVPKEIQRGTVGGETSGPSGSGPGTPSDDMKKMKPEPVTQQELEQSAEKTHGGGAAIAAEDLKEKSMKKSNKGISDQSSHKAMKNNLQTGSGAPAGASDAVNDGPKKDPKKFQQPNSDTTAQGQQSVNKQPM